MNVSNLLLHLAAPSILVILIGIFVHWRIQREFPLFFAYMLYVPVATALRISMTGRAMPYYWLYWMTEAIYGVAEVLVIREVLQRIFSAHSEYSMWSRLLLPATVLVILGITLWQTVYHPVGRRIPWLVNATYWFDLGVHLLEGIILFLLAGLGVFLPTQWMKREYGILSGFGVAATITLFAYLARFAGGSRYELFFRYGPPAGYIAASLIWLHAFVRPVAQGPRVEGDADEMGTEISKSKAFLGRIKKPRRRKGRQQLAIEVGNWISW